MSKPSLAAPFFTMLAMARPCRRPSSMNWAPQIVTGHDFRAYSAAAKSALVCGLMAAGCKVHDTGLALTPMAYFAQFDLDVPCVSMVTADSGASRP